jgi:hypothetical protein
MTHPAHRVDETPLLLKKENAILIIRRARKGTAVEEAGT